ncbi:MAG: ATP-binding protein [Pelagimonas sp.]|jgi:signal transduction histidine kinase|nr:ATP-binding protein [Pelagimonas sp.]
MLELIRSSVSKPKLLKQLFDVLRKNEQSLVADYAFELQFMVFDGKIDEVRVQNIVGAHNHQIKNFHTGINSRRHELGTLLEATADNGPPIEFMLIHPGADNLGIYNDDFRELIGNSAFWLCLMPLPKSTKSEPRSVIVFMYRARSVAFEYQFPRGAIAEWQIIEALPSLYSVIDFQLGTLAEQVAAQRRNLIMELAPQAINHEITNQLGIIGDIRVRLGRKLVALGQELDADPADFIDVRDELVRLKAATVKAQRSTEAFSNIERRSKLNRMLLVDLFEEIEVLYDYKLENKSIFFDYEGVGDVFIETDTTMVEHVMLNVVSNAIDAISATAEQEEGWTIRATAHVDQSGNVEVMIGNNGPEVPLEIRHTLFQKGITTKARGVGHGQGLYICRLVANFLGGEFTLVNDRASMEDLNVVFSFLFPQVASHSSDLMENEIGALRNE